VTKEYEIGREHNRSWKVAGSSPDKVIDFCFSIHLILPAALGSVVSSVSNGIEYKKQNMFMGSRTRPARKADNLAAIYELIV
jgi:hypothetical protein